LKPIDCIYLHPMPPGEVAMKLEADADWHCRREVTRLNATWNTLNHPVEIHQQNPRNTLHHQELLQTRNRPPRRIKLLLSQLFNTKMRTTSANSQM
jgi:hypothetical protein